MKSVEELKEKYRSLCEQQEVFECGDIIYWKEGLQHKRVSGPFVVTSVLVCNVYDSEQDAGSPYYKEQLDIKAACFNAEGFFVEYHFDSRRFTLAEPIAEPIFED